MSSTKYVYVPICYFGDKILNYLNIKESKNAIFVGYIIRDFKMSNNIWYLVYWFSFNIRLWITSSHLTNLPKNSNIINGITYITKSNENLYEIKKNIKFLDYNENIEKKNNQKQNEKVDNQKQNEKVDNKIVEQKALILKTTMIYNYYFT